ncbi:PH-like domain-containing protein [Microbacterium sp. No. 7]|uniref:PH-like domain-containing protein n=1 Tax=Microbacterium sp. No. 7 TaxID=1714373 RepID=UPI0006CFBD63|nr:hypothetical protein [Microbacterium sp. No. 7]ALJ20182.1 hypothetical protein AOA12_09770 [Microbacterium sp. No. 7]
MTREIAIGIMIGFAVVLLALGLWGWLRRARRDSGIAVPVGEAPANAATRTVVSGLYVATTRHAEPLERLSIRGLTFRSRADVTVTDAGVALDLTGQPRIFFDRERIAAVEQATVAIDRVVERDGLVRLSWRTDAGDVVDSYFRPQESSARALTDAISGILTPASPPSASADPSDLAESDA